MCRPTGCYQCWNIQTREYYAQVPKYNFQIKGTLLYLTDLRLSAHFYTSVRLRDATFKYIIIIKLHCAKKIAWMTCTNTNTNLSGHYCHLNTVGHRKISFPWFLSCPACSLHNTVTKIFHPVMMQMPNFMKSVSINELCSAHQTFQNLLKKVYILTIISLAIKLYPKRRSTRRCRRWTTVSTQRWRWSRRKRW
jgi:hypothetical protein